MIYQFRSGHLRATAEGETAQEAFTKAVIEHEPEKLGELVMIKETDPPGPVTYASTVAWLKESGLLACRD